MIRVRNTLAVLAFTALFGCAVESPASTPTIEQVDLALHTTHATQPLTRELTETFTDERPEFQFEVTTQSYDTLMTQLETQQLDYFVSNYVPVRDDIWAAPLAQDGLIIITHPDNPITDIDTDNIRKLFGGQITSWQSINGVDQSITLLTYQDTDDIYHEFHRLVMGRQRITSNAQVVPNINAMIEQVASTPTTIGYIPFSHTNETVMTLSINGIQPTTDNLSNNIYPLRTTIFVVGREEPPPKYRAFFSWVQSDEGQRVVAGKYNPLP